MINRCVSWENRTDVACVVVELSVEPRDGVGSKLLGSWGQCPNENSFEQRINDKTSSLHGEWRKAFTRHLHPQDRDALSQVPIRHWVCTETARDSVSFLASACLCFWCSIVVGVIRSLAKATHDPEQPDAADSWHVVDPFRKNSWLIKFAQPRCPLLH